LIGIDDFDFGAYHSSQYARMAEKLFKIHFPTLAKSLETVTRSSG
jgi:hypothetical protein